MNKSTRKVILFILKVVQNKPPLFFWLFVRFISAILPLITIYLFSEIISLLEKRMPLQNVFLFLLIIFVVRIFDNFLRLKSITKLEQVISNVTFDINNYFLSDLVSENKQERHETVQAVRNFSDASSLTLNIFKQPGVDAFVSLIFVPLILFFLEFKVFVIVIAYISVYYLIDYFTTQKYMRYRDIQNLKTEIYFAKLQDSNDFDLEQKTYTRHFSRLSKWNFKEWFALQNTAVFFYSLVLLYLIYFYYSGQKTISEVVLIMGYVSQTQVFLNAFSNIKDSLTDMFVSLEHLAKNKSVSVINLDDLI
jgi:ABC-type multidrug transport system fused ATPase/permease subunit